VAVVLSGPATSARRRSARPSTGTICSGRWPRSDSRITLTPSRPTYKSIERSVMARAHCCLDVDLLFCHFLLFLMFLLYPSHDASLFSLHILLWGWAGDSRWRYVVFILLFDFSIRTYLTLLWLNCIVHIRYKLFRLY
jgi:hypothetical protein